MEYEHVSRGDILTKLKFRGLDTVLITSAPIVVNGVPRREGPRLSSDAPVTMEICDKCGKPILESEFRQCRTCGDFYDRECYMLHRHGVNVLKVPPLYEWIGPASVPVKPRMISEEL